MATGLINVEYLRDIVAKSPIVSQAAKAAVYEQFALAKGNFIDEFESHDVSKEINAGPGSDNLSKTLGPEIAGHSVGNLFAFIGFPEGDKPIEILREFLEDSIRLSDTVVTRRQSQLTFFRFQGFVPTIKDIEEETPIHWAEGSSRSWVHIVENGTDSFSYYLYQYNYYRGDQYYSGSGAEAKEGGRRGAPPQIVRQGQFQPTDYMTGLLQNFIRRVGSTDVSIINR